MHIRTKFGTPTSMNIRDMLWRQSFLKLGKGHSDPKMVCDTQASQDALTHQIWNFYLKEYKRYAPDSMQFLKTSSEVKFKVTVTQLWYATLSYCKMRPHTKFEIPTSNNIKDMHWTGQKSR